MKIYLTRHSKTLWNQEKRLQGWQDSPLTDEGIEDAKKLKKRISELKIDCCYSSPIIRAKATSEILFDHVITDERLKEMNFGQYEGCLIDELVHLQPYIDLWHHPDDNVKTPDGETYHEVQMRLNDFFADIYKKHPDDTIFITIHGMLFIILHGLMLNYKTTELTKINKYVVRGCSLSEVEYDGKQFTINYIGDDSHLAQAEIITYQ